MPAYKIGLVDIKIGAIAGDGGMGTTLVAIGNTVADSPSFTTEDPTKQDFNIEEQDAPVYSITTSPGKKSFAWSCYDVDADTMVDLFGGTKVAAAGGAPEMWKAPNQLPEIEKSLQLNWKNGGGIDFPRVKITSKVAFSFKKTALSQIDIVADVLQPTKANEPDMTIRYAN